MRKICSPAAMIVQDFAASLAGIGLEVPQSSTRSESLSGGNGSGREIWARAPRSTTASCSVGERRKAV